MENELDGKECPKCLLSDRPLQTGSSAQATVLRSGQPLVGETGLNPRGKDSAEETSADLRGDLSPLWSSEPWLAGLGTVTAGSLAPTSCMGPLRSGAVAEVELEGQILWPEMEEVSQKICRAFEFMEGFLQVLFSNPVSPTMSI